MAGVRCAGRVRLVERRSLRGEFLASFAIRADIASG